MTHIGQINAAYLSDRGQVREHNEDFVLSHEPRTAEEEQQAGWIYVVADGVGGADAGEVASSYATKRTIHHYLNNDNAKNLGVRLQKAIRQAHDDLCALIETRHDQRRMGTTLVATVLDGRKAFFANVGDSRGYHLHAGRLKQVTKDHSLVAKLVEEGIIGEEEAADLNIGNIILQSIGSEQPPTIDLFSQEMNVGDKLLLCSDGLTNHVADEELGEILHEYEPPDAARKLVDLANERGGYDNITVLVLSYD